MAGTSSRLPLLCSTSPLAEIPSGRGQLIQGKQETGKPDASRHKRGAGFPELVFGTVWAGVGKGPGLGAGGARPGTGTRVSLGDSQESWLATQISKAGQAIGTPARWQARGVGSQSRDPSGQGQLAEMNTEAIAAKIRQSPASAFKGGAYIWGPGEISTAGKWKHEREAG